MTLTVVQAKDRCKNCGHWWEAHIVMGVKNHPCRVQICHCTYYEKGDGTEKPR